MLRERLQKLGAGAIMLAAGSSLLGGGVAAAATPPPVAVTAPATTPTPALTTNDVNTWLDGLVPAYLNSAQVPGAFVTVVKDGQVITTRTYGYADVQGRVPVTEDTLFQVGSISKIPTTIAALQLVEQGKLDLDADISTYVEVPLEKPVTLRNLLTHTAGFEERRGDYTTYREGAVFDLEDDTLTDPPQQIFEPGTVSAYSNYGIQLVGYIIQQVTGTPFEQHIEDAVFAPAGMELSTYRQPLPEEQAPWMATGYETTGTKGRGFLTVSPPAGSMVTSGHDAGKFMLAQLEGTVMSERVKELAWNTGIALPFPGQRIGLGYFLGERNGHETVGHGGATEYFHSMMELYPNDNTGIFISMNSAGKDHMGPGLYDTITRGFADRYFPGEESAPLTDAAAVERAAQVEGKYAGTRVAKSNYLKLMMNLAPLSITATEDGGIIMSDTYYQQIEPWVWEDIAKSHTIAADPSRNSDHLLQAGAMDLEPVGPFYSFGLYGTVVGLGALLLALLAWPLGAWRRMRKLSWVARIARIGAVVALAAITAWGYLLFITSPWDLSAGMARLCQGLQLISLAAIIPAGWSLIDQVRTRAGWSKILSSCLLLLGLVLLNAVAITYNLLSWDVSI